MDTPPLLALRRNEGFVEVTAQGGDVRAFRDRATGLTVLFCLGRSNSRELWRGLPGLLTVYEFEDRRGHVVQLPVIATDEFTAVQRLIDLVHEYAAEARQFNRAEPHKLFDTGTRRTLSAVLAKLSATPQPQAVEGFVGSVLFCVDGGDARRPPRRAPTGGPCPSGAPTP